MNWAIRVLLVALASLTLVEQSLATDKGASVDVVRQFAAAFNAHDAAAMAALATDTLTWYSVRGDEVTVELRGKHALVANMTAYFDSCPSCRSKLGALIASGHRVSVVEVASWHTPEGVSSQQALAVYEVTGDRISAVYYFAEEDSSEE